MKRPALDVEAEHLAQAMADVVPLAPDPRGRVRPAPLGTTRSRLADTRENVERLIQEAIALHIEGLREDGLPVPQAQTPVAMVDVK